MVKKVMNYMLVALLTLVLPTFVLAQTKTIGKTSYTILNKSYEIESNDYYYLYGIISPSKFIVYEENIGGLSTYHYFNEEELRETEATAPEVIESRKNLWLNEEMEYFLEEPGENPKLTININNIPDRFQGSPANLEICYIYNTDLTPVDGKEYFLPALDAISYTPVLTFEEGLQHHYLEKVDCADYGKTKVKDLTPQQTTKILDKQTEIEEEYEESKYRVRSSIRPIKIKTGYILGIRIEYRDEDTDEADNKYDYKYYDFDGKEITRFAGVEAIFYSSKTKMYVIQKNDELIVLDENYNEIYRTEFIEMQNGEYYYYYLFEVDSNRLIIDFEYGDYTIITRYTVLNGKNQQYKGKDLTVKFNGELSLLKNIKVNGKVLDKDKYSKKEGSTIITLKNDYLKTLKAGTYTLRAEYTDGGYATTTFKVEQPNPATFDNVMSFVSLGSISLIAMLGMGIYIKKNRYN